MTLKLPSFRLLALLLGIPACVRHSTQAASADPFAHLVIPPDGVGTCERGPHRGSLMEWTPPAGQTRVAITLGHVSQKVRTARVILDVQGRPKSYMDELNYDTAGGVSISHVIAAGFDTTGKVVSGMEHLHEMVGGESSTDKDRELSSDKRAAVAEAAKALLRRCSPEG